MSKIDLQFVKNTEIPVSEINEQFVSHGKNLAIKIKIASSLRQNTNTTKNSFVFIEVRPPTTDVNAAIN